MWKTLGNLLYHKPNLRTYLSFPEEYAHTQYTQYTPTPPPPQTEEVQEKKRSGEGEPIRADPTNKSDTKNSNNSSNDGAHRSTPSNSPPSQSPNNPLGETPAHRNEPSRKWRGKKFQDHSHTTQSSQAEGSSNKVTKPVPAGKSMSGQKRPFPTSHTHTLTPKRLRGNLAGSLFQEGILSRGDKPPYPPSGCT